MQTPPTWHDGLTTLVVLGVGVAIIAVVLRIALKLVDGVTTKRCGWPSLWCATVLVFACIVLVGVLRTGTLPSISFLFGGMTFNTSATPAPAPTPPKLAETKPSATAQRD